MQYKHKYTTIKNKKLLMNVLEIIKISQCTGCGVCEILCPKKCIIIKENNCGFLKININAQICINCGVCIKGCHLLKKSEMHDFSLYGGRAKDIDILENSRSGGLFYLLAKNTIEKGGIAIGASFDKNFEVGHVVIDDITNLWKLQGSKYVQSTFKNVFKLILENKNRPIVIGATSCQIASILSFIEYKKIKRDNIILVDIVCYGTPSKKILRDYLKQYKKITKFDFRDKSFGWEPQIESIYTQKGKIVSKEYANMFISRLILTDNCFECKYRNIYRVGDISLADFWGLKEKDISLYSPKGNSLFFINNNNGLNAFNEIKSQIDYFEVNKTDNYWKQPALKANTDIPNNYIKFWKQYRRYGLRRVYKKYFSKKNSILKKIIRKVIYLFNRFIKH